MDYPLGGAPVHWTAVIELSNCLAYIGPNRLNASGVQMQSFSAHDAKARFGQLLDTARREPVTIEKHGRAVAVVISKEEFDDIEAMRLERLRAEIQKGLDASAAGDFVEVDASDLESFVDGIMTGGAIPTATA